MAQAYNLDTREQPSNLYGIGKGAAQVFDQSGIQKANLLKQQQQFKEKQLAQKTEQAKATKREDELLKLMAKSRGTKLKPGDVQYFKDAQADLNKQMRDALDDNEINNDEYIKILGLANQINAEADMAGAQKLQLEAGMGSYDKIKHRPEGLAAMKKAYETEGGWGEQFNLTENVNYDNYYRDLRKDVSQRLSKEKVNGFAEVTRADADDILSRDLMGNRVMMDQVKYNMSQELGVDQQTISDEQAVADVQDRYSDDLAMVTKTRAPTALFGQAQKDILITIDETTRKVTFTDPGDPKGTKVSNIPHPKRKGERIEVHSVGFNFGNDADGNRIVEGATATISLTDEQLAENRTVYNDNLGKEGQLQEKMTIWDFNNKPPEQFGGLGVAYFKQTDASFQKELAAYKKKRDTKIAIERANLDFKVEPNQSGTIELNKKDADKLFFEQTKGIKTKNVLNANGQISGAKVNVIPADDQETAEGERTVVRRGIKNGRTVVQYSDGTIEYE